MSRIINTESFILKSREIHNGKYGYDKTIYTHSQKKVLIFCKSCGKYFEQRASHHLEGSGCPVCKRLSRRVGTEEFIERSISVHGDRYDYSKSIYTGRDKKIEIICKEPGHGSFFQVPHSHWRGDGCPECSKYKKLNTQEFIRQAKESHGNKYSYEKTVYVSALKKVTVHCNRHNHDFKTTPNNLLRKIGCPICVNEARGKPKAHDTEKFIKDARSVHGDLYDYSLVDYKNCHTKISIRCVKHDSIFTQEPSSHLAGNGCPTCGREKTTEAQKVSTEEFIEKLKIVHGDKYDYSKVDYVDNQTRVWVRCKIHDKWNKIMPASVLRGSLGCPICARESRIEKKTSTTEEFIIKAKAIHGDRYIYDFVDYKAAIKKVIIQCVQHGKTFKVTPNSHLGGSGCPWCNRSKMENKIEDILSERGIKFVNQKTFKECKYKNRLKFDFFLPDHNMVIEYHGGQHYEPVGFYGGKKGFIERNIRDMIKRNYCEREGIKFLEIPYWEKDNVEKILTTDIPAH